MANKLHVVLYVKENNAGKLIASGRIYKIAELALYAFAETPCVWSEVYVFNTREEAQAALENLQDECNNPVEFYKKYGDSM